MSSQPPMDITVHYIPRAELEALFDSLNARVGAMETMQYAVQQQAGTMQTIQWVTLLVLIGAVLLAFAVYVGKKGRDDRHRAKLAVIEDHHSDKMAILLGRALVQGDVAAQMAYRLGNEEEKKIIEDLGLDLVRDAADRVRQERTPKRKRGKPGNTGN